jgi:trimeric autotransporter adhesin
MRPRLWVSLCLIFGTAGLALFASSCGSSNKAHLRLLNAMVTESSLDMLIDGSNVASNVGYASASGYISVNSGSRHVQIEPTGSSTPVIDITQTLNSGNNVTALAYLNISNNPASNFLVDNNSAPSSGNFNIRVINASPAMGSAGVDVYVIASGTSISGVSPNVTALADGSASGYLSLAAGDYDVIFALPGTKSVLVDSGQVSFGAGQVLTAVGLNSTQGGLTVATLHDAG